jgi:outer membrane receptor protein involved in Fe transport
MRWQHSADHWQNELLFTYENSYYRPSGRSNGNGAVYTYGPQNNAFIINTGPPSPLATQNKGQKGPGLQDDFTLHGLHWLGEHTVKFGGKFKEIDLTAADAEGANLVYTYNVGLTGTSAIPYKVFFAKPVAGSDPFARSKTQQFGLYIQDDWATTDRLTLNLGLRWDYEKNPGYDNFVTPANVQAALRGPDPSATGGQTYAQSLALGGVNVNDYISTGSNRKPYMGAVQPRLGFSFDVAGDQKHVVFGGLGRSFDRDSYNFLQLEQTKGTLPVFNYYFSDAASGQACGGTPCLAWDANFLNNPALLRSLASSSNAGSEVYLINNNIKPPHSDQFSIGMRNKVGDWNTSAALARINSYDGLAFTLGNRRPDGGFWLGGGQPWGNGIPGFGNFIVGNAGIETRTTQVLLSAEKPYTEESHWGATVAYTYTSAQQNRDINEHYAFDGASIQKYPFILSNAAPRHRLVSTATLHGAWDVIYGVKLTLATPTPVDGFACFSAPTASGAPCVPAAGTAQDVLGYRQLDLQATKNFEVAPGHTIWVRLDALNVLDSHNYADSDQNFSNGTTYNQNPIKYVTTGNIVGVPATLRLSAGYRF